MAGLVHLVDRATGTVGDALSRLEHWVVEDCLQGWTPARIPDLSGMVALVTGANSGIGFETTRKLAENGAKVYMVCRKGEKGRQAAAAIQKENKQAKLEVMECDLSELRNVVELVNTFKRTNDPLHILVNMAGTFFPGPFKLTKDGLEQTMAVNFYSHALLTLGLLDHMAPGGRVVMMSSEGEGLGRLDWDNLRGDKFSGSSIRAYGASKLYTIMWSRELAERVKAEGKGVDVFVVQPGLVRTPGHYKMDRRHYLSAWLVSGLGITLGQTPYHGSWSTLYAATEPSLQGKSFAYIGPNRFGMYHAQERLYSNAAARNTVSCWKLFDAANKVLSEAVEGGHLGTMPPVPAHPTAA